MNRNNLTADQRVGGFLPVDGQDGFNRVILPARI